MPDTSSSVALRLHGIAKSYGNVHALKATDLKIDAGTVHAFVGENGAGKSSLLKILAGAQPPSAGQLELFGESVEFRGPRQARHAGVVAVYQELTIVPAMTALENVFLGHYLSRGGVIDRAAMTARFESLRARMAIDISPTARAGDLSIADQQVLEIMRALNLEARVLLLDEPTASLALHEREALGATIRSLVDDGVTVVWISHDLEEILALSDAVSVFRDGQLIDTKHAGEWDKQTLVAAMLGGKTTVAKLDRVVEHRDVALEVRGLMLPGVLHGIDFDICRGEILGIAGLMGAGRTEILRSLAGAEPNASGTITASGLARGLPRNPREAIRLGIALAPEDRKAQGLVLPLTTTENIGIPRWRRLQQLGVLTPRVERHYALQRATEVAMNPDYLGRTVRSLSGGNQQKAVIAKWAATDLTTFLVDEPTRGIDIAAKAEIYQLLDTLTKSGTSVVLVSSEFEELIEVCDRVIVIAAGQLVSELDRNELSEQAILSSIFGVSK